jgi:tetratricopeptide (TPR) repeat protein
MNLHRREFLQRASGVLIPAISVAAATCFAGATRDLMSKPKTLAQEYLSIESAIGASDADANELAAVVRRILTRIQPFVTRLNLLGLRNWEAIHLLNQIGGSLNQEGFRFGAKSTLMCTSLRTRILACHYAACLVYAVGEDIGLPLSMLKVPSHVFLRLRLENGTDLNWDIYLTGNGITADDNYYRQLFRIDTTTAKRGGYLCNMTRNEMLALEYNGLGVAWMLNQEWDRALASFSDAIALDPRLSEAFKNCGCAKFDRAAAATHVNDLDQRQNLCSAIADLQEAVKINKNYHEALYTLGQAYFSLNELDAAREFLNAAKMINACYGNSPLSLAVNAVNRK